MRCSLMDSGASVSVLGKGSLELLENLNLKYQKLGSFIETADGSARKIEGYVYLPVTVQSKTETIMFCIVPSLKSKIYLGIDFWRKFGLFPNLVLNELSLSNQRDKSHTLSENDSKELEKIKNLFPSFESEGLGHTHMFQHEIHLKESCKEGVKQRYYSISPAIQKELHAEIDRMLGLGVIEECVASDWSSPAALVRKSTGKVRCCLDARRLNEQTTKDSFPLPLIDGLLGRLHETKYISSLDLKDAFWQIPLAEKSRPYTAFTVPGRPLYQFKVMPFGLCNAAQSMCRLMHKVIPHQLHDQVIVYLDDLLIISATLKEHFELLERVAGLLRNAGLTINVAKSHFVQREIKYLGFLVGELGLRTDPEKVEAIRQFPVPVTTKQIRRFLGMSGWYQRFVENYAGIAAPITDCLKKGNSKWSDEAQKSFEHLKEKLMSAPVLVNPNYNNPFWIRCDASNEGLGAVLFQKNEEGLETPIAYMSQKLKDTQKRYTVTELECLAAIVAVKKFRPYVEGHKLTLITDHASLKWLMRQKDLGGRLARWSLKLQAYDFEIQHQKGSENVVPDALSRVHCDSLQEFETEIPKVICSFDLNSSHFNDEEYVSLRKKILENPKDFPAFKIHNDRIYIRLDPKINCPIIEQSVWKMWIPSAMTPELLKNEHDDPTASHGGVVKTLERLRRFYFWPKMTKQVKEYIGKCEICKTTKPPNQQMRPPMGLYIPVERPFQRLYIDLLGPYPRSTTGKTMLLIILDHFSKFVVLKPLNNATASQVVRVLKDEVFCVFGVPEKLHSDNGKQFNCHEYEDLLKEFGVRISRTAVYSPQSNQSERVNRSIVSAIRSYLLNKHTLWDKYIPEIGSALRNSFHETLQFSPHYTLFGYHKINHGGDYKLLHELDAISEGNIPLALPDRLAIVHDEIQQYMRVAYEKSSERYNLRSRPKEYSIGDVVYVRMHNQSDAAKKFSAKLAPQFKKAVVNKKFGTVNYELKDEDGRVLGKYHAKDIK